MTNKDNKVRYTLRVPKKLKSALEKEAKRRGFTLNALIITKLENETTSEIKNKEAK